MLIVTRYKAAKIAKVTEVVFSKMFKRQQTGKQEYEFFEPDGKINIDHPNFQFKYGNSIDPEEIEALREKIKNRNKPKPVIIKTPTAKKTIKKETAKPKILKTTKQEPPKKTEGQNLQQEKTKWEIKKLKEQNEKLKLDNQKNRNQLIPREEMDRLHGYMTALNKNIMGIPLGFIDEFESGVKAGYTRSKLMDILTVPICEAIAESKAELKKELARFIREKKKVEVTELDE